MTCMGEFIKGAQLSRRFYHELVEPLLSKHFPGVPHAAAFLGYGSDVLGYDTPVSRPALLQLYRAQRKTQG